MEKQYIETTKYGTHYYSDEAMTVLHREDGPAVEDTDGHKEWYINGKRHREGGPALEWNNGDKEWYIHGTLMKSCISWRCQTLKGTLV